MNSTGTGFVYSALLDPGIAYGIALDSSNDAYVTGQVYEDDYPTTSGAYQTTYSSGFITELNPGGSSLIYSTFLGGSSDPFTSGAQLVPSHIALPPGCASSCEAFVAGYTNVTDLPLVSQVQSYIPGTTNSAFYIELAGTARPHYSRATSPAARVSTRTTSCPDTESTRLSIPRLGSIPLPTSTLLATY